MKLNRLFYSAQSFRISLLVLHFTVVLSLESTAQSSVVRAMKDEIERGMNELQLKDHNKPFYMFCRVEDQNSFRANASFGALLSSNVYSELSLGNFRVLCGSYDFNDESLNQTSDSFSSQMRAIAMPEDSSDYEGIRRSIWSSMESIYIGAAKGFAKNQETLHQKGLTLEQMPHKSFGKIKPSVLLGTLHSAPVEKEKWEAIVKQWSDSLANISGVTNSNVSLSYSNGYTYMYSTEGTIAKLPHAIADLHLSASTKNSEGTEVNQNVSLLSSSPSKLIDKKIFENQLKQIKERINLVKTSKSLTESYSGPILFLGEAAAHAMMTAMFDFEQSLTYTDDIKDDDNERMMFNQAMGRREVKIGTSITNANVTVRVDPSRAMFGDTELMGRYGMDDEGAVPQPLTLIEDGALRSLMNNRTITAADQPANGYSGSIGGVIEVSMKNSSPESELKKKLMEAVKKDGLDYGIIIRQATGGSAMVFKVSATGDEELLSPGASAILTWKSLRKLIASSDKSAAYNLRPFNFSSGMDFSLARFMPMNFAAANGISKVTSMIVPTAILVGDLDLKPSFQRRAAKEYVSRPD